MYEFIYYQVRDVMTSDPIAVDQHLTLGEVEPLFEAHDSDCLPVVDETDRLLGLITELDFFNAFIFEFFNLSLILRCNN